MTTANEPNEPMNFEEMELHSDIQVERNEVSRPPRRRVKAASRGLIWTLLLLLVAALVAVGFLFVEYSRLRDELHTLQQLSASTEENLSATAGNLQASQKELDNLAASIAQQKQALAAEKKSVADLTKKIADKDRTLQDRARELDQAKTELAKTQAALKDAEKSRDQVRADLVKQAREQTAQVERLEAQAAQDRQQLKDRTVEFEQARDSLRDEAEKARKDYQKLQRQFEEEAQASMAIIKERAGLKADTERMTRELDRAKKDLSAAQTRVRELESVKAGDLVPFGSRVTLGVVRFKEPLPDGVRIPKRLGNIAVQVLVSEVGGVEEAFIIPGQDLDAELSTALVRAIYKWKFTPPTYDNIRVKTWQTLLVSAE